jgi:hypothetical protein
VSEVKIQNARFINDGTTVKKYIKKIQKGPPEVSSVVWETN